MYNTHAKHYLNVKYWSKEKKSQETARNYCFRSLTTVEGMMNKKITQYTDEAILAIKSKEP